MKKNLLFFLLLAIIITCKGSKVSANENNILLNRDNLSVAVLTDNDIVENKIDSNYMKNVIQNLKLIQNGNQLLLKIQINDNQVYNLDIPVKLYMSQLEYFENGAVIGINDNTSTEYNVLSFRIENNATDLTLLEPNLDIKNHILLSIAIRINNNQNTYYLQIAADDLNFDDISSIAKYENVNTPISLEEIRNIEEQYLELGEKTTKRINDEKSVTTSDSFEVCKNLNKSLKNGNRSLLNPVPDSVFKSGNLDKMTIYNGEVNGAAYTYAYYQSKFAGTDNRITYVALIDRPYYSDFSLQTFSYSFNIITNGTVIYNAYSNELEMRDHDAKRITIKNLSLAVSNSVNDRGIIRRAMYDAYIQENIVSNILQIGLSSIPKVGTLVDCFKILTSKSDTKCGYDHLYQDTYDKQVSLYGSPIRGIYAEFPTMKYLNDSAGMFLYGTSVNNCTYKYNATFEYN